jgi:hypothetical protein
MWMSIIASKLNAIRFLYKQLDLGCLEIEKLGTAQLFYAT